MVSSRLEIRNPTGLHIRPAAEFVRLARTFGCAVCVHKGERSADAKNLIKLLRIGIAPGDVIELTCDGADEVEALAGLTQFLRGLEE